MRARAWILWAVVGAGLLIAGPAQWWFTWIGERRVLLQHAAERQRVIDLCAQDDAIALVEQQSGAIICARGSNRMMMLKQKEREQ